MKFENLKNEHNEKKTTESEKRTILPSTTFHNVPLNSIQDGPLRSCSRMERWRGGGPGGLQKAPSLKSIPHILQRLNFAVIPYLRKNRKIYESRDTPPEFS